jgi:hypothetical protein
MFGLENQKSTKKVEPFVFDIEKELMSATSANAMKVKIESAKSERHIARRRR